MKHMSGSETVVEHFNPRALLAGAALLAGLALCVPTAGHAAPRALGLHRAGLNRGAPTTQEGVVCPPCDSLGVLENISFSRPHLIDNPWLPLKPGYQLVLQGQANRGGGPLPHLVIFTVTDLVKRIAGIPCVVVFDQDINEGVLSEAELAFFAQDDNGNLWNTGEYPEEYENGVLIGAENTWIHGIEWAEAGVNVRADRDYQLGTPGWEQARAPENDFWDCAETFEKSRSGGPGREDRPKEHGRDGYGHRPVDKCVPAGCYQDWITVKEWAPLDGCDVLQTKTHAYGVGIVEVGAINDPEGETLVLIQANQLAPAQMAEFRARALELDARGYLINEIYAQTVPAELAPPATKPGRGRGRSGSDLSTGATAPVMEAAPLATSMRITPNPAVSFATIAYSVEKPGAVDLGIFDVAGRRIRSIVRADVAAGAYRMQWDGRNDAGQRVAGGMYFARLRTASQVINRTVVISE